MADIDSERELVTIQSFRELSEAMLAKGMLNSAGIECFLVDDNTGHMLGFISNVIGGIRMKVNKFERRPRRRNDVPHNNRNAPVETNPRWREKQIEADYLRVTEHLARIRG